MGCGCGNRRTAPVSRRGAPRRSARTPKISYEVRNGDGEVIAVFLTAYEARVFSKKFGFARPVTVAA